MVEMTALAQGARRIERAEAEQLARTGPPGRPAAREIAGGLAVFKGPGSAFSAAMAMGLSGRVDAADVDAIEQHLGAGAGPVRVEVTAPADPSLAAELGRRGYRLERILQVWHRPPLPLPAPTDGPLVRPIRDGEELAWVEVFSLAFFDRSPGSAAATASLLSMTTADGNTCFAAFERDAMVGVAIASAHRGVAILSGAGVPAPHRGRGIQLGLVRARLAWAAERGCDVAAAMTAPGTASQRTLERAGFRCAYPKAVMVRDTRWA
jgi:hypothetical protein